MKNGDLHLRGAGAVQRDVHLDRHPDCVAAHFHASKPSAPETLIYILLFLFVMIFILPFILARMPPPEDIEA